MSLIIKDLQVPVVISHNRNKCNVYIPDFNMTVHGIDYVDTLARAIASASAIYYYNSDRNLKMNLTTTFAQAEAMCKSDGSFATFICLTT